METNVEATLVERTHGVGICRADSSAAALQDVTETHTAGAYVRDRSGTYAETSIVESTPNAVCSATRNQFATVHRTTHRVTHTKNVS